MERAIFGTKEQTWYMSPRTKKQGSKPSGSRQEYFFMFSQYMPM